MDLIPFIKEVGLPGAAAIALGYYAIKGSTIVWRDLIIPFRDAFLGNLATNSRLLEKIEEVNQRCERIENQTARQQRRTQPLSSLPGIPPLVPPPPKAGDSTQSSGT